MESQELSRQQVGALASSPADGSPDRTGDAVTDEVPADRGCDTPAGNDWAGDGPATHTGDTSAANPDDPAFPEKREL